LSRWTRTDRYTRKRPWSRCHLNARNRSFAKTGSGQASVKFRE
jgi:hypothetical protein